MLRLIETCVCYTDDFTATDDPTLFCALSTMQAHVRAIFKPHKGRTRPPIAPEKFAYNLRALSKQLRLGRQASV